jgi:hypothetical protein
VNRIINPWVDDSERERIKDEYVYSVFNIANTSIKPTPRVNIDITEDKDTEVRNNNINSFIN